MKNHRRIGTLREEFAVSFLESKGLRIIDRNFHCKHAEIDIIAQEEDVLVFVEVKFRSNSKSGFPHEAVSSSKQKRISMAAAYFLIRNRQYAGFQKRFDLISILGDNTEWIKNAFEFQGNFPL